VAEFIIGNPPFIGAKYLRERLGDEYTNALWAAHPNVNESADLVMYWWDRAADELSDPVSPLRRFGFVTTNSITQEFSGRVIKKWIEGGRPISLVMAIPDHPWTKITADAAAVRIAMTVAEKGECNGVLRVVAREENLDSDHPIIEFSEREGRINADLTIGTDVTSTLPLRANEGVCSPGVKLHGDGFIITPSEARFLGLGRRDGLENYVKPYRHGRDISGLPRGVMVIDLFGLAVDDVRRRFPEVYQHVLEEVKERKDGKGKVIGRDANNRDSYRTNWWLFGEPRSELRPALAGISRFIVTPVTAKNRFFQFLETSILPDDALMCFALDDAFVLGVLSSSIFAAWFDATGSTLEDRPRFIKSRCFDPFPFPDASDTVTNQSLI
jgi:restriction-modification enzyme MmeI-like protein